MASKDSREPLASIIGKTPLPFPYVVSWVFSAPETALHLTGGGSPVLPVRRPAVLLSGFECRNAFSVLESKHKHTSDPSFLKTFDAEAIFCRVENLLQDGQGRLC